MTLLSAKRVYLDWAASAPPTPVSRKVCEQALASFGNPSALHREGREAKTLLEEARTTIARLAEIKTDGVVFTSGATEANALALLGAARAMGTTGTHVLYSPAQHVSILGAIQMLKEEGAIVEEVDMTNIQKQLRPETVLVTLDAVCGETGTRYDTLSVRRALDAYRPGILLHVDASQAPLTESCMLAHLGADMLTLDAQKVGGMRGIGALLVRQGIHLTPLMRGGGQEGGRRPGTENPALAHAFAVALSDASEKREEFSTRSHAMREKVRQQLAPISNLEINESETNVGHILNISLLGRDTDYAVMLLNAEGFAVSTKSACESNEPGSRAVLAMTGDVGRAAATLRISWGPTTTSRDLSRFCEALIRTVRFLDEKVI